MRRRENIAFYVLFSIIIGAAAGLALGIAFDKLIIFTIGGAVVGLVIGLFTANDKRVVSSKSAPAPKKTTKKTPQSGVLSLIKS